ncbi:MAG: hypothetical protein ABSB63_00990 [Spirochaetia bacterium]|jgi:hypothetical protein
MNEKEAKRVFDHNVALYKILGGDLKTRCLGKGMTEQQFDMLIGEHQRMSEFIAKHDSERNIKQDETGS